MVISDMNERECGIIFTEDGGHNIFIRMTVISI